MLICPTTVSYNLIPQQLYEICARNYEGAEILFYLPTNKVAWHKLMGAGIRNTLLDHRKKNPVYYKSRSQTIIYTSSSSSNSQRAMQWGLGDSGVHYGRNPKFRKPQSFKGAISKPVICLLWAEGDIIIITEDRKR